MSAAPRPTPVTSSPSWSIAVTTSRSSRSPTIPIRFVVTPLCGIRAGGHGRYAWPRSPDGASRGQPWRVVYVGRLVAHKRVDVLLDAASRLEGVELEIAGEGPETERLQRRARELGVATRVTFLGPLAHDHVMERLAEAD